MSSQRRSWMFVPGSRQHFLEKASTSNADCVLLDLEDGVLPDDKAKAREMVGEVLGRGSFGPERFVRINAVDTPWHADDLAEVVRPGLAGVCLPKVESPSDILTLVGHLEGAENAQRIASGSVEIVAAIESAQSLIHAVAIASSHPRVIAIMFGAEDFSLDLGLGAARSGEAAELLFARSSLVVAAASARVLSIDGVFPNLEDARGLEADVLSARRLGFTSKSTFNPRQIAEINRIFSPQPDELNYARRVVAAFEAAQRRGDASVAVGGQLVDLPIVRRAQRLLRLAEERA